MMASFWLLWKNPCLNSGCEQTDQFRIVADAVRFSLESNAAAIHYITILRNAEREFQVLLDDDYRDSLCQLVEPLGDFVDDPVPHAFCGFVQHQQIRQC